MIEMITIILAVILIVMVVLLGVLCILYFKSKNKKEGKKENIQTQTSSTPSGSKTVKNYSIESVFDFMEFDKIEDNMISTKNGAKYVMVVECQGVNYDLMSEIEKNAVEEGFIQFLNTLRHPIQIYTQTRTINLENSIQTYRNKIKEIEEKLEKEKNRYNQMVASGRYTQEQLNAEFYELTKATNLYEYGKDIIYTTERMSLNKNVLNQKYYIVIPYYPDELGENNFDKQEIRNLAFSELYTRAQSIIRTLSVCGINSKILDSTELAELLYVAYNRDESETFSLRRALNSGYEDLYTTAPDVLDKRMKELDVKIEEDAIRKANEAVYDVIEENQKQKRVKQKEAELDKLIDQMAKALIEENKRSLGNDVAESAVEKIDNDSKKKTKEKEGGEEDGKKTKTTRRRVTKSV